MYRRLQRLLPWRFMSHYGSFATNLLFRIGELLCTDWAEGA